MEIFPGNAYQWFPVVLHHSPKGREQATIALMLYVKRKEGLMTHIWNKILVCHHKQPSAVQST